MSQKISNPTNKCKTGSFEKIILTIEWAKGACFFRKALTFTVICDTGQWFPRGTGTGQTSLLEGTFDRPLYQRNT